MPIRRQQRGSPTVEDLPGNRVPNGCLPRSCSRSKLMETASAVRPFDAPPLTARTRELRSFPNGRFQSGPWSTSGWTPECVLERCSFPDRCAGARPDRPPTPAEVIRWVSSCSRARPPICRSGSPYCPDGVALSSGCAALTDLRPDKVVTQTGSS